MTPCRGNNNVSPWRTPKEAFRYVRNYLAGQFIGATRDDALLDELLKCLFCRLLLETDEDGSQLELDDPLRLAKQVRALFAKVRNDFPAIYSTDTEILLDPKSITEVMRTCSFSLLDATSDPIGDAFEVFVGAESRSRSGQFFTPRIAADFLVQAVGPGADDTILDPACGAGGFLASVARHFAASGISRKNLPEIVSKSFIGIDKDEYLVKLARLHISLLTRGHPRILFGDSIALRNGDTDLRATIPSAGVDVVLTNPPFGTKIVSATEEVLREFDLARKWNPDRSTGELRPTGELQGHVPPQVLFVERCLSLLRPGGRLGMVLPESVLSNKSYRHVVAYLVARAEIDTVVGMPESLFKTSGKGGTHTKTCLLVATKKPAKNTRRTVFMAEARWCGHDSRARAIDKNDLPEIAQNLITYRNKNKLNASSLGFQVAKKDLRSLVLCPRYYDPEIMNELEQLSETHDLLLFGDLVDDETLQINTGDELGKLAYGTGPIPFIRTSDISNWELKADPKHSVDRSYYESLKAKQDVRPRDILLVKDGTYLVGTAGMVSEHDTEIVFQSHLYKIRVLPNRYDIDAFLLLAVLSSPVVLRQIRSKQFTQDIIDSLGERIRELVLPIPKSAKVREEVAQMVQRAIQARNEARELAAQAQLEVLGPRFKRSGNSSVRVTGT